MVPYWTGGTGSTGHSPHQDRDHPHREWGHREHRAQPPPGAGITQDSPRGTGGTGHSPLQPQDVPPGDTRDSPRGTEAPPKQRGHRARPPPGPGLVPRGTGGTGPCHARYRGHRHGPHRPRCSGPCPTAAWGHRGWPHTGPGTPGLCPPALPHAAPTAPGVPRLSTGAVPQPRGPYTGTAGPAAAHSRGLSSPRGPPPRSPASRPRGRPRILAPNPRPLPAGPSVTPKMGRKKTFPAPFCAAASLLPRCVPKSGAATVPAWGFLCPDPKPCGVFITHFVP